MKNLLLLLIIPFLSFGQMPGCLDENACNYTPEALYSCVDDWCCEYSGDECEVCNGVNEDGFNCIGPVEICYFWDENCNCVCGEDNNDNGICDDSECGCLDESACNYSPEALSDCEYMMITPSGLSVTVSCCLYDDECLGFEEFFNHKSIITIIDILGREATNKGFQLHIYDDGSVEKKYLIK